MFKTIFIVLVFCCIAIFVQANHNSYYSGPVSDHFDGKKFFNPGKERKKGFLNFLKWKLTANKIAWPEKKENKFSAKPPSRVEGDKMLVTYIGHMTFLIQTAGLNILTDPIFSERASPVSWAGPKRVHDPGIEWENLPKIDLVLISHNHYDHLDLPTLKKLYERDNPLIIVPIGNDKTVKSIANDINVEAYDWGDIARFGKEISVHVDPSHHWSSRGILDRNNALWTAYTVYTPGGNIYFSGDTGYGGGDHFNYSMDQHEFYRLAILAIGAYEPRWFMRYSHMDPKEAVQAYFDLGEPYSIASHFDVFKLTDEGYGEAVEFFEREKKENNADKFRILQVGEIWDIPKD